MMKILNDESKALLIRDLCSRLPYKPKCYYKYFDFIGGREMLCAEGEGTLRSYIDNGQFEIDSHPCEVSYIMPFLRPMSSMTEKEQTEFNNLLEGMGDSTECWDKPNFGDDVDWLNAHHFDYRGLIDKGLALPAKEDMYEEFK